MVFNPPVLRPVEGEEPPEIPTVKITQIRDKEAYIDQARRAGVWIGVLFIGWLLTRLTCEYDFPPECNLPNTGLEVLTDLLTLFIFGFAQAWFAEILEQRRFRHLYRQFYFGPIYIFTGLIISILETTEWWKDLRFNDPDDFTGGQIAFSILAGVLVLLFVVWHFAEAWRILPGAYYVSGNVPVKIVIEDNLHRVYNVSRGLILVWALMYAAFAHDADQGWELHYALIAWALSLLAQFKAKPSIVFLAITTAVFVQGFGAYGVDFVCNNNAIRE